MLRIGFGGLTAGSSLSGLRPFIQNLSNEALAAMGNNGRPEPRIANRWDVSGDGLRLTVRVRPNVRFHDGTPVTAPLVVEALKQTLPVFMGAAYGDVSAIDAVSNDTILFRLRRASSFLLDSLEVQITKPGTSDVGTGPFVSGAGGNVSDIVSNVDYYLGPPSIQRIVLNTYPSVRAAWADLLRQRIDMLYEVGSDALDSLQTSTTVNVYQFNGPYQHVILLNSTRPALRSPSVRRALNVAVNRNVLIREALNGHAAPSSGPVWPRHWALDGELPTFTYDPAAAAGLFTRERATRGGTPALTFTCLVAPDHERLALAARRQLETVGVEMRTEDASIAQIEQALATRDFEAILLDLVSGPSMFRPYSWWHSHGSLNRGVFSSSAVDAALDSIRHATSDDEYRAGVARFQEAILDDPPAIFLAWSERARAVSKRVEVPPAAPGVDILGTLRLWRPVASAAGPGPGRN